VTRVLAASLLLVAAVLHLWTTGAVAAPSLTGPVLVTPPADFTRGTTAAKVVRIDVPTTEDAVLRVSLASPFVAGSTATCATDIPGVACSYNGLTGDITVANDGLAPPERGLNVRLDLDVTVGPGVNLFSMEGTPEMSAPATLSVTVSPRPGTTGAPRTSATGTVIMAGPSPAGESVLALVSSVTSAPGGSGGRDATFTAAMNRSGNVAQVTAATVTLVPDVASGTTITPPSSKTVNFAAGDTDKTTTFTVNAPAGVNPSLATYHVKVEYAPMASSSATDTETGLVRALPPGQADLSVVVAAPASVTLSPREADVAVTYTLSNLGPDLSDPITLVAEPPASLKNDGSAVKVTDSGGGVCAVGVSPGTRAVTCTFAPIAVGTATKVVKITWTIEGTGSALRATAASTAPTTVDPVAANNSATATVAVGSPRAVIVSTVAVFKNTPAVVVDLRGTPDRVLTVTQPANGKAVIGDGGQTVTYAPNTNYLGEDSFSFTSSGTSDGLVKLQVVERPQQTIRAAGVSNGGSALPATGGAPFGLTLAGMTAILLGSMIAALAIRRRAGCYIPLHIRK